MSVTFDRAWADEVVSVCDPVFAAADVGFGSTVYLGETGQVDVIFWMANPERFLQAYPDSGVDEMYGPAWPHEVADIDFTVKVDAARRLILIDAEPWNLTTILIREAGDGEIDGINLARIFARLLGVDQRQFPW